MMRFDFATPTEVSKRLAQSAREKRLALDLSQSTLSKRSGVSLGVLKKFESTGKISLESLLKLAMALGNLSEFIQLFKPTPAAAFSSLEKMLTQEKRLRGRK